MMMDNLQTLELKHCDGILLVYLKRPKVLNAVTAKMRNELAEVLSPVNDDNGIRGVAITGAGDRAFCAGQDLDEAASFASGDAEKWMEQTRHTFAALRDLDKPCVSAINGVAAGAGLQLALLCDLRVGHSGTRMGQPEIKAGLASVLGSYLLSLYFGHARSVELSLTARFVHAEECLQLGLLNRIVAHDKVVDTAVEMANELAEQPPGAFRLTKQRYRHVTQAGFDDVFNAAIRYVREAYESGEPQAVMSNFVKRRTDNTSLKNTE
ncbi:MAG: Short-chain-enoyl-CoA hydratase [Alphaproteobacteria bacterium MarineAlpha9_Bin7]|nr:MAG: Short-chain-enoyl-CoA hydratase [Alphaproteobacteria bacterium MarineAlpha9_Bin7]